MSVKIAVLAGQGESTAILLNWLQDQGYKDVHLLLEAAPSRWKQLQFRRRKLGIMTALGQVCFGVIVLPWLRRQARARRAEILLQHHLRSDAPGTAAVLQVESVNAPAVAEKLNDLKPEVILVNGTGLLRRPLLEAVQAPILNIHAGITPQYRGVHGGYWALHEEDRQNCGATLHLVDAGVDTGQILHQCRIQPTGDDNFSTYPLLQQASALPLLGRVLQQIAAGQSLDSRAAAVDKGQQWYLPTLAQYFFSRLRGIK